MKRSRFSEEQIIGILREHEAGSSTADVCRKHGVSSATFYKRKAKFGGLDVSDARRLTRCSSSTPLAGSRNSPTARQSSAFRMPAPRPTQRSQF
jgi:putative transposase